MDHGSEINIYTIQYNTIVDFTIWSTITEDKLKIADNCCALKVSYKFSSN